MDQASALLHDGKVASVENISSYASAQLAYTLDIERGTVRIGDAATPTNTSLRVTTIFRREADGWKVVHRHADPITSPSPPDSLIQPT